MLSETGDKPVQTIHANKIMSIIAAAVISFVTDMCFAKKAATRR